MLRYREQPPDHPEAISRAARRSWVAPGPPQNEATGHEHLKGYLLRDLRGFQVLRLSYGLYEDFGFWALLWAF